MNALIRFTLVRGIIATAVAVVLSAGAARAVVLTGPITNVPESIGTFCWGDGTHDLCHQWSWGSPVSGYFYGTIYGWSNADIYVAHGLSDPTTVTNAAVFPYTNTVDVAYEGDTVFFRGANGYYGAWKVTQIDPLPNPTAPLGTLSGTWYFQADGTGCFAPDCGITPAVSHTWGRIKAIYR